MKVEGRILALDLATRTGWALWSPGAWPEYGNILLPKTGDKAGAFLGAYREWLVPMIEQSVGLVVYEQPIMPGVTSIATCRKLYGMAAFTELVCHDLEVSCREIPMQKWRKHFMGRGGGFKKFGTTPKVMAVEEAERRGFEIEIHDEADALGILDYAAHMLEIKTDWPDRGLLGMVA